MRKYIRHTSDMPLEFELGDIVAHKKEYLNDVSQGGLSFRSSRYIEAGSIIKIQIPIREPMFQADGVVVWCREKNGSYDVGVIFKEFKSEYGLRMVEQVCHIEHYKKEVLEKEGRKLTGEQAAIEWISKYAKDFPK